jgi:streptogramin lyase
MMRLALAAVATAAAATAPPPGVKVITLSAAAFPDLALTAQGSLWVEAHREALLYRIDPRTNAVKTISLSSPQCGPLAYGARRIWFSSCFGITGVARSYGVPVKAGKSIINTKGGGPAFAAGSLWVVDETKGVLIRTDPRTGVVLKRIKLAISEAPNGQWAGTPCSGSLWVTNGVDAVQRIDLATNTSHVVALPGGHDTTGPGYFAVTTSACAAGKVWVPNGAGLFELDPATGNAKLLPISIASFSQQGDVAIVAAGDDIYLRTSDTTVVKIDGTTEQVVARFPASGGGGGIAVADGSLWVVNAADGTVWREPLP